MFEVGDNVTWTATQETGVVIDVDGSLALCKVQFPIPPARWISHGDLRKVEGSSSEMDPSKRLVNGDLGEASAYVQRLQSIFLQHAYQYDPSTGLSNARIEPKLHQVYVAHTVTKRKTRPRMILADEVGLGKTIEAALIIKELRARLMIDRVLIIAPASLTHQWQSELQSKFNEQFEILTGPTVRHYSSQGRNAWAQYSSVIASLPLAQRHAEKIVEAGWDFVVFDEAHRVRRSGTSPANHKTTQAYRLADELQEHVYGMLMLTATPMQLHPYELFSLIEITEPGTFRSWYEYDAKRSQVPELNRLMLSLQSWRALGSGEREAALQKGHGFLESTSLAEHPDPTAALSDDEVRESLIDEVSSLHPHADVLVRNRKAIIGGFADRKAVRYLVQPTVDERRVYEEVSTYIRDGYAAAAAEKDRPVGFLMVLFQKLLASSTVALTASFERRVIKLKQSLALGDGQERERPVLSDLKDDPYELSESLNQVEGESASAAATKSEIKHLERLISRLKRIDDSKIAKLLEIVDILRQRPVPEKVLVFTQFIETQAAITKRMQAAGMSVVEFNGRQSPEEKEQAVRRFRENAQVLVSTEAGGEGRNFQFCHFTVNFDLPWNPMKVEQRIGRLDRIGQKHTVHIYNLALAGTVEERVLDILERRIGLFEESVGSLDPILGKLEGEITEIVLGDLADSEERFQRLEADVETRVMRARELENTVADFAMDRASFRRDEANDLLGRKPMATHSDLRRHVAATLDYWGGTLSHHSDGGDLIALSPKLKSRLGARSQSIRGAFDPLEALRLEDVDFFAIGHPTIDAILGLSNGGHAALTSCRRLPTCPSGTHVEVYYSIEARGGPPFGKLVRHLIDQDLSVVSTIVDALPEGGTEEYLHAPPWAQQAIAASWATFGHELEDERRHYKGIAAETHSAELERAARIFEHQRLRLQESIDDQRTWIELAQRDTSERIQRILPARRGALQKAEERLELANARYEDTVAKLESAEPGVFGSVLAAGVVLG